MNPKNPGHFRDIHADRLDLAAARNWMSAICGPHRLHAGHPEAVRFQHSGSVLKGMSTTLGCIEYGTEVTIGIVETERFNSYSLSLPLVGEQELSVAGRYLQSNPQRGVIVSPNQSQELNITGDCRKLQVVIPLLAMRRTLEEMLQRPTEQPLVFEPEMDSRDGAAAAWWRMVRHLNEEMALSELFGQAFFSRDLERALLKGLILAQPNNYSEALRRCLAEKVPHYLLRAREHIHAHAREALCLDDLEEAAGVSRFKLFEGFRRYFGSAPMTYLKHYRLHGVREDILAGGARSISEIAMGWGFAHLGRFAGDYRKLFGETPSATQQRLQRLGGRGGV
ncbi:AraC family transcriptional regulator [Pseudomonas citronellolis]|uniref:AraC family transcriptional regulator n=1 Tax=Pseudomonas citronellolis TaxID=53408 RepID=UPI0026479040|nr:AraC family transcriptional regulator [Pseudomonas citronellolis]MDN6874171.1 AraC family transcriptional regulator [Pseudomonas citronellolis]